MTGTIRHTARDRTHCVGRALIQGVLAVAKLDDVTFNRTRRIASITMQTTDDSFVSAWSKARFPEENRAFVKWFCDEIGISGFRFVPADYRYIAATRRDGAGELRIHWGCTISFTEAEARHFGANADEVRISNTGKNIWLVSHPEHRDVSRRGPAGTSMAP